MIKKILDAIAATSSRIEKETILRKNVDNNLLKKVCLYAYNPYKQYYIKAIPEYTHGNPDLTLDTALHQLDRLSDRTYTGHRAIDFLSDLLSRLMPDDAAVLSRVIKRDLSCGASEATLNKIWPDLIPTYPCLLASSDDPKARAKVRFPAIAQEKCDGMRINAIMERGNVSYRSRAGKPVDCHSIDLDTAVKAWGALYGGDLVIDGELLCWGKDDPAPMPRKVGNGICNKAIKGTISDKERGLFVLVVWDLIPLIEFKEGFYDVSYRDRYERVKEISETYTNRRIIPVNTWIVNDWEEASHFYSEMIKVKKEGLIIKNMTGIWEDKRSPDLVKMKEVLDFDARIVDIVEGDGKYRGMLGSMVVESEDKKIRVEVGSGFTDAQRREYWNKGVVGKIVTLNYNEKIQAKDGTWSLFLPIFVELRNDKTTANYFSE